MTASTTPVPEFQIDQIATLAFRHARITNLYQTPSPEQMGWARDLLNVIVEELDTESAVAKSITFELVTLVAGQYVYTLSTNSIDVIGDGMFLAAGQPVSAAGGEISVRQISREDWHTHSGKDATGQPTEVWINKVGAALQPYFWPIPSSVEAGASVRLPVHRLRGTMSTGSATPDFERFWSAAFQWELAHYLAVGSSKPLDFCNYLATMARDKIDKAKGKSNQRPAIQIRLSHPTGVR